MDIIRLAFGPFFIHEPIHGIIRLGFDQYIHDLEQGLSQNRTKDF